MSDNKVLQYKQAKGFYTNLICLYIVTIVLVAIPLLMGHNVWSCPIKFLFHIPCPGCGLTRSFGCILHCDISTAFYYNHSSVIVFPFAFVVFILLIIDIICNKAFTYQFYCKINRLCNNKVFLVIAIIFFIYSYCHAIAIGI